MALLEVAAVNRSFVEVLRHGREVIDRASLEGPDDYDALISPPSFDFVISAISTRLTNLRYFHAPH